MRVRVREGRGGGGAGRVHKAVLSEGHYGERRGAECLGQAQRLKETTCRERFPLQSGNLTVSVCRSFSCTF